MNIEGDVYGKFGQEIDAKVISAVGPPPAPSKSPIPVWRNTLSMGAHGFV